MTSDDDTRTGVSPGVAAGVFGRGRGQTGRVRWGYRTLGLAILVLGGVYAVLQVGGSLLVTQQVATFPDGGEASFEATDTTYVVLVDSFDIDERGGVDGSDARCDIRDTSGDSRVSGVGQLLSFSTAFGESVGTFRPAAGPVTMTCSLREALLALDLPFDSDDAGFRVAPVNTSIVTGLYAALGAGALIAVLGVVLLATGARAMGRSAIASAGLPPSAMSQAQALMDAHRRGELPSTPPAPSPPTGPPTPGGAMDGPRPR